MDAITSTAAVDAVAAAIPGTSQASAAMTVLKKSLDIQEAEAALLLQALPEAPLAKSGAVGTQLNTYG